MKNSTNMVRGIDIDRLKKFIDALESLIEHYPEVNIQDVSPPKPECGTPGCHAGLALLALNKIQKKNILGSFQYDYDLVAFKLSNYLTRQREKYILNRKDYPKLCHWAQENQDIWENLYGKGMFASPEAFDTSNYTFPSIYIVNKWKKVYENLVKEREEGAEK